MYVSGLEVDVTSGRAAPLRPEGVGLAVADPTGLQLAAVDTEGRIVIVNRAADRRRLIDRRVANRRVAERKSLRFAPDGQSLAVLSESGSPAGELQLELWSTEGEGPPIRVAGPLTGDWLFRFSGDGNRLVWWCSSRPFVVIAGVRDGSTVAELPLPPETEPLESLALNPDGTQVAWYAKCNLGNAIGRVTVQDVATGAIVRRLPTTGFWDRVDELTFAPDGRFLVGHESSIGQERTSARTISTKLIERVMVWDLKRAELVLWLPGKAFAEGISAVGELAVLQRTTEQHPARIVVFHPAALAARIADAELGPDVRAADFRSQVQPFLSYLLSWPMWLAFIVFVVVARSTKDKIPGEAMPPNMARLTVVLGTIAIAGAILRILDVFDRPDWMESDLILEFLLSVMTLTPATFAVWYSVRRLASVHRGDNVPVSGPSLRSRTFNG